MARNKHDYFLVRAEKEIDLANRAASSAVAKVHFELAARYLDLAHRSAGKEPDEALAGSVDRRAVRAAAAKARRARAREILEEPPRFQDVD